MVRLMTTKQRFGILWESVQDREEMADCVPLGSHREHSGLRDQIMCYCAMKTNNSARSFTYIAQVFMAVCLKEANRIVACLLCIKAREKSLLGRVTIISIATFQRIIPRLQNKIKQFIFILSAQSSPNPFCPAQSAYGTSVSLFECWVSTESRYPINRTSSVYQPLSWYRYRYLRWSNSKEFLYGRGK